MLFRGIFFIDIIMEVRHNFMQNYTDCHIDLPHEHYDITQEAYDLWKAGAISFYEAKKQSNL